MRIRSLIVLGMLALPGVSAAKEPAHVRRTMDVDIAPGTQTHERNALCFAFHPRRPAEVGACLNVDWHRTGVTLFAAYRKTWHFPGVGQRGLELGLGPSLGARYTQWCPYGVCAVSFGPETGISLEVVQWLNEHIGLTLQADVGLAVFVTSVAPRVFQHGFRSPLRVTVGVAF